MLLGIILEQLPVREVDDWILDCASSVNVWLNRKPKNAIIYGVYAAFYFGFAQQGLEFVNFLRHDSVSRQCQRNRM